MLMVRCAQCRQLIPTGLDVSLETFRDLTYTERTAECPHCDHTQVWTLDDVDRSVFGAPKKS
jgi:DNA-directed RNA polymerase subunit RPC12/RpoP